jgi:hypothetical protein
MTHNRILFTQLKVSQLSFVGFEASGYLLSLLKWIMPLLKIMYALIVTDTAQYVMLGGVTCIDNQQGSASPANKTYCLSFSAISRSPSGVSHSCYAKHKSFFVCDILVGGVGNKIAIRRQILYHWPA